MSILTWFKSFYQEAWFKLLVDSIMRAIKKTVQNVGQDAINKIKDKIKEVATSNMTNAEKFTAVFEYAKSLVPYIGESALRLLIEALVQELKSKGSI